MTRYIRSGRDVELFPHRRVITLWQKIFPSQRKPLTPEQRQARDASRRIEAEKAMRDHEAAQKAFYDNRERLRAERLAREAAAPKS